MVLNDLIRKEDHQQNLLQLVPVPAGMVLLRQLAGMVQLVAYQQRAELVRELHYRRGFH